MKIFKGLWSGLLIGLMMAVAVSAFVVILPAFSCTWELISCFFTCGSSGSIEDALSYGCDILSCSGPAESFPFGATFFFSLIICTVLGIIWGISTTISEHKENNRLALERETAAKNKRYAENQKEVVQKLEQISNYANSVSGNLYEDLDKIEFLYDDFKNEFDLEWNSCEQQKQETESLVDSLTVSSEKNGGSK